MIRLIVGATLSMVLGAGAVAQQPIVIGQTIATTGSLAEHGRGLVLGASTFRAGQQCGWHSWPSHRTANA